MSDPTKSLVLGIPTVSNCRLMSSGESERSCVCIDQCVSAMRVVEVPVFLLVLS